MRQSRRKSISPEPYRRPPSVAADADDPGLNRHPSQAPGDLQGTEQEVKIRHAQATRDLGDRGRSQGIVVGQLDSRLPDQVGERLVTSCSWVGGHGLLLIHWLFGE